MRNNRVVGLVACLFAATQFSASVKLFAAEGEKEAISKANAQFYSALNEMFKGDVEPMKKVWSHADDVTYMGPAGDMQVGWNSVLPIWKAQASKRLGGKVRVERLQMHVGRDLAVTSGYEMGENIVDGKPQKVSIRATNIFRKEEGQWKMIGHHTDILPFLAK
jgi:ketosteroid isomerase-like protein